MFFLLSYLGRTYIWKSIKQNKILTCLLGGLLVVNFIISLSPNVTVYGYIKLFEMGAFFFLLRYFFQRVTLTQLLIPFLLGTTLQCFLSFAQFSTQSSQGGLWYFLGERTFTGLTPGIANASLFGQLILRPYGTLPHPNVLGAYLLVSTILLLKQMFEKKVFLQKQIVLVGLYGIHFVALLLTLSRTSIIAGVIGGVILISSHIHKIKKAVYILILAVLISVVILLPILTPRFLNIFSDQAYTQRVLYVQESYQLLLAHPFLGVGWNAYLPAVSEHSHVAQVQPVHSVILLVLTQVGIVGILILLYPLYKGIKYLIHKQSQFAYVIVGVVLFLGFFDHYFLTIQQGQLILIFLLAIVGSDEIV